MYGSGAGLRSPGQPDRQEDINKFQSDSDKGKPVLEILFLFLLLDVTFTIFN